MPSVQPINSQRLLDRFLRYVRIDTTANPQADHYPSSQGQWELGKLLADELQHMGASQVEQDEHGLVWATVPANLPANSAPPPTILFNAHLDTSPDASGKGVDPQVIESYGGGDIPLPQDGRIIRVADCPALNEMHGQCLVTTDGRTLLGGDDKAGVAAIMELAQTLLENPQLPHGELRILFTCDEEIGRGAQHMDLHKANAFAGYTLDGSGRGVVEDENFSADLVTVTLVGANIHPSIGKGRMVNAARGLALLLADLPVDEMSPEATEGRQGFLHPYAISGDVSRAQAHILLRNFQTAELDDYVQRIQRASDHACEKIKGLRIEIQRKRQYRNMADALRKVPQVVEIACRALEVLGQSSRRSAIRGGTDGAVFSEMGLPTPNLSVGQHNIHSVLEFASLDEMVFAVQHAIQLLALWQSVAPLESRKGSVATQADKRCD